MFWHKDKAFTPWTSCGLLTGIICLLQALPCLGQDLNFKNYKNQDGLPQSQITAVFQTKAGYIWIGSLGGAARFNGQSWQVFTKNEGLSRNHIISIAESREGWVYLGTLGGGLNRFRDGKIEHFSNHPFLSRCTVNDMASDVEGRLWVATDNGLARIEGEDQIRIYNPKDGLSDQNCRTIYQTRSGLILTGTRRGLDVLVGDRFEPWSEEPALARVQAIVEDTEGSLYFATNRDLLIYQKDAVRSLVVDNQSFPFEFTDAKRDYFGRLWFSTVGNGLIRIYNGEVTYITTRNGLANQIVSSILVDRENNLWFGTDFGLSKLSEGPFVSYTEKHGLVNNQVRSLYEDQSGDLWIGTWNGVCIWNGEHFEPRVFQERFPDAKFYSIVQHPDGRMLLATKAGLSVIEYDKLTNYLVGQDLPIGEPRALYIDSRSRIWIGGIGVCRWDSRGFHPFPDGHLLSQARIVDIEEDRSGNIWFATRDHGLLGMDQDDQVINSYVKSFDVTLWSLESSPDGNLWIGTNGLGLFRLSQGLLKNFSKKDGLTDNYVWQILHLDNHSLLVGHNKGIDIFKDDQFVNYSSADGLSENETSATASIQTLDGSIWIGTGNGLTRYFPNQEPAFSLPPIVLIDKVVLNRAGREREITSAGPSLSHRENALSFYFSGLSFHNEEAVRYRFMLEGYHENWIEKRESSFQIANLESGDYTFKVLACNDRGVWSDNPATFQFKIAPALWQTVFFRMAVLLVVLVFGWLAYRFKVHRIEEQTRILEELVLERTHELAEKNRELKELSLSDTLTRLKNRRYVNEIIPAEIKLLRRRYLEFSENGQSLKRNNLGVLMVDVDHFKSVNDNYGHDAGDLVLKKIGQVFKAIMRSSDVTARWGGEEFLILVKDVKIGFLGKMAEKILEHVRMQKFEIGEDRYIQRTCSIGFAYLSGKCAEQGIDWDLILKLADSALYIAKHNGRDRAYGLIFNEEETQVEQALQWREDIEGGMKSGVYKLVSAVSDSARITSSNDKPAHNLY